MSSDQDVQREIEQLEQRFAENSRGLVFAHLADAYRRAREYAKAEGLILHGLKNHPSYISAYNVLGRIYLDSDRLADAHEQFSRVLELDPHNLIALRALGDLAARAGHADEARSWYEQMLQVDPRNDAVREEIRKLSEPEGEGERAPASEAGTEPETAPADASEAASTTHPGSRPGVAESSVEADEREASPEEEGRDAGVFGIMDAGDLGDVVDEVPDQLAAEADSRSLEAMPWEDIRDVSSLDLEAGAEVDQGLADRTAVEPEAVEAEDAGSVEAEVEDRLESLVEGEVPQESPGEATKPATPDDRASVVDLTDMDDWMPGLFEGEPKEGEAKVGTGELEADNFIDALEQGFDSEAEAEDVDEEPATPAQEAQGGMLVTETMAELYARQGLHAEALNVYRQLAERRPDEGRLQQRIAELEERLAPESESESIEESELLELLDITGMAEEAGERSEDEEAEAEATGDLGLESKGDAPTEAMAGPGEETRREGPTEDDVATREEESALEDVMTASAFAGAFDQASGEEEFEFVDEVPVAGLEQLDPFAASFEVMGRAEGDGRIAKGDAEPEGAAGPGADESDVSIGDAAFEDADRGEDEEVVLVGMPDRDSDEHPSPEMDEGPGGIGSLGEAVPGEPEESREAAVGETAGEAAPEDPSTIERYLSGLLEFDPEGSQAEAGAEPVSLPRSRAPESSPQDSQAETEIAGGSEDLEQFQEWLRGLRH